MTLTRFLATGSGSLAARIEIEGLSIMPVTDPAMEDPKVAWGIQGWSASNYYAQGATATMDGSSSMTRSVLFRLDTGGTTQTLFDHLGSGSGWLLRVLSGNTVEWRTRDGSGDYTVTSAALTVGEVYVVTVSFDGSNLRMVLGQTASTPVAGGIVATTSGNAHLGVQEGGSNPASGCTILGAAATDSYAFATDAAMQAFNLDVMRRGQMQAMPSCEHLYRAQDLATDIVGSADWTVNGRPTRTTAEVWTDGEDRDGRRRVYCTTLFPGEDGRDSGIVFEESVNIPEAVIETTGFALQLFERDDEAVSSALAHNPSVERIVTSNVDIGATSITLGSVSGISAGDVVHLHTEAIKVASVGAGSINVTGGRGYWGTTEQKHWTADGDRLVYATVSDRPFRIRGRRVTFYLYGDSDDLQGDGTQKWIGRVKGEPQCTNAGSMWRVPIGPLTDLFKGKLGGELANPMYPRGAYYSWAAPLDVKILEDSSGSGNVYGRDQFTGFFETQSDFVSSLTTWLQSASREWNSKGLQSTFRAEELPDGTWTFAAILATGVTHLEIVAGSGCDGECEAVAGTGDAIGGVPFRTGPSGGGSAITDIVTDASAGDVLYAQWVRGPDGARSVPRGHYGRWTNLPVEQYVESDRATYPEHRIYLSRGVQSDWESIHIDFPEYGGAQATITASNTTSNYIDTFPPTSRAGAGRTQPEEPYTAVLLPEIKPLRTLATGSLDDMRNALVTEGPEYANRGTAPFITGDDIADWTSVLAEVETTPWLSRRLFQLSSSVELGEFLQAEFRLRGVFPVTDSTGKIALKRIELPNAAKAGIVDIDEEIVDPTGWSTMVGANQSTNRWILKRGYDPVEDDWTLAPFDPFNQPAYAQDHEDRPLEVAPRSVAWGGRGEAGITWLDAVEAALPVLGLFAWPYDIVSVSVPWTQFDRRLGDFVKFSADHLPNRGTGKRPITDAVGIVVGRRFAAREPYGQLQILISWQNIAGYSPTARVTGTPTNDTGNQWTVTIDTSLHFTSGDDCTDHFDVGDEVRVVQYDSETPTKVSGTVDAVTATTLQITFDGTWTPGLDTWDVIWDTYTNVDDGQEVYAGIAGADGVLDTGTNPRTYAP